MYRVYKPARLGLVCDKTHSSVANLLQNRIASIEGIGGNEYSLGINLDLSRVPSPLNLRDGLKSVFSVAVPCSLLWISFLSVL
ncbi:hypothetical protein BgiMline_021115 [Biomphalaria glabrata]